MEGEPHAYLNQLRSETILRLLSEATRKSRKPACEKQRTKVRIQFVRVSERLKDIVILLASLAVVQRGRPLVTGLCVDSRLPRMEHEDSPNLTSEKERTREDPLDRLAAITRDSIVYIWGTAIPLRKDLFETNTIQVDGTVDDGLPPFLHNKNPPSRIMVQNELLQVLTIRKLRVNVCLFPNLIEHITVEITVHNSPVVDESIQLTLHPTPSILRTSQRKMWSITFIGIFLSTLPLAYLIVHSLLVPEVGVVQPSVHPHSGVILLQLRVGLLHPLVVHRILLQKRNNLRRGNLMPQRLHDTVPRDQKRHHIGQFRLRFITTIPPTRTSINCAIICSESLFSSSGPSAYTLKLLSITSFSDERTRRLLPNSLTTHRPRFASPPCDALGKSRSVPSGVT